MAKRRKNNNDINEDNIGFDYKLEKDGIESISNALNELRKVVKTSANAFEDLQSFAGKLDKESKNIGTSLFGGVEVLEQINKILPEILNDLEEVGTRRIDLIYPMTQLIAFTNMLKQSYEKSINAHKNFINEFSDNFSTEIDELITPFNNVFNKIEELPFGNLLIKSLKLDTIKEEINDKLAATLYSALNNGTVGFASLAHIALNTITIISKGLLKLLLNPVVLIVAGIAGLVKMFIDMQNESRNFQRETGLSADSTRQLRLEIQDSAAQMSKFGVTTEDAFAAAISLYNEFGNINIITQDMVGTITKLNVNFGVGVEQSARLLNQFIAMNDGSEETARNLLGIVAGLSDAAGVGAGDVFKDIAENSELISTYFKGNTKELLLAAVHAHRLGLNLTKVGSMIDSLIDFESSIEKELEASLLLGKSINFNKARQMIFNGDIKGATDEMLKQIGTLEDFNKLNLFQRKAIAEATGQTVSDLENTLLTQEKLSKLTAEQTKEYDDLIKKIEQGNELNGESLLNSKRQQVALDNLLNSLKAIGLSLSRIILPILYLIEPVLEAIAWVVNLVSDGFNEMINGSISGIGKLIGGIVMLTASIFLLLKGLAAIKVIGGIFGSIIGFGGASGVTGAVSGAAATGSIASIAVPIGIVILAVLGLAAAFWVLSDAVQKISTALPAFSDFIMNIVDAGTGLFTAAYGIMALSTALTMFSAAVLTSGIVSFFSGDPISQFERLADIANDLNVAASGVERLTAAIENLENMSTSVEVLPKIGDAAAELNQNLTVSSFGNSAVDEIKRSNLELEKKIENIAMAVSNMQVSMDGKVVGKIIGKTVYSNTKS